MNEQEKELIEKSKHGDIESFELLIKEYQPMTFNIAFRMLGNIEDAKDVSQDAFIKIYKSLHTFKGDSSFSTWLYRIVTNTCLDELRKMKRHRAYSYDKPIQTESGEIDRNLADQGDTPEEIVDRKESRKMVVEAINNLSDQHRVIIVLRDIKGFSYEQIGEILDCPEGTIKSRISRARYALKTLLEKDMELYSDDYVKI